MTYCKYWLRCVSHAYSVGFCCNVELTLQLVSVCKTIVLQVINDSLYNHCVWYQHTQPAVNVSSLFSFFNSLWLVATIDCDVFELSDQTTINFTKTRKCTERVSGWVLVLEWDMPENTLTVIIDISLHPMEASRKVDLFWAGYVQSHRRCSVIVVYYLSCSYLEQLTDYR